MREAPLKQNRWEVKITASSSEEAEDLVHLWKTRWPFVVGLYDD